MPAQPGNSTEVDIEFRGVTKNFGDIVAVDNVSLSVERGSFFSLLGPSGCGKTTSLRLIAGFEQPSAGDVTIGGQTINGIPAHKRPVNMVFQHYSLFPHLNVADNVGYGLRQRAPRPDKQTISLRVAEALEMVQLSGFEHRRSWELSGGQQQRVALARALINRPTVLLLDEPLAALDRKLRQEMQIELQTLQREVGITFVLVTHDQEEALSMSDKICIMLDGRVVQVGSPRELYDEPKDGYVAGFVGKTNFFAGEVVGAKAGAAEIKLTGGRVMQGRASRSGAAPALGRAANLAVRPELIHISPPEDGTVFTADIEASARVKNRIFLGEQTEYLVDAGDLGDILILVSKHAEGSSGGFSPGDAVKVGWDHSSALAFEETPAADPTPQTSQQQ
ncbi:MAG: ABC transporter ATP-binding protein [Alphaproteobacteria bacterium]